MPGATIGPLVKSLRAELPRHLKDKARATTNAGARQEASTLTIFKAEDYLERGFEIALKEKITVYDAIYIALAEDKGATLFTSDRKQYDVAKRYVRTIFVG